MARRILFFWVLIQVSCRPDPGNARNFKDIFDHYRTAEHVLAVSLPPSLAVMVLGEQPDQKQAGELLRNLSSFHLLIVEDDGGVAGKNIAEDVSDYTLRQNFHDLLRIETGFTRSFIRILESEGHVKEAVMMFEEDGGLVVIDLRGNIRLEDFMQLAEDGTLKSLASLGDLEF